MKVSKSIKACSICEKTDLENTFDFNKGKYSISALTICSHCMKLCSDLSVKLTENNFKSLEVILDGIDKDDGDY